MRDGRSEKSRCATLGRPLRPSTARYNLGRFFDVATLIHFSYPAIPTVLIFFVVALLMLIVALAFVVVPLIRNRANEMPVSGAVSNVAIYKSQRRELDEELARGAISDSEHRAALGELSLRVVDEVPEQAMRSGSVPTPATRPWWLVAVMAIVVPLGAALLYSFLGTPQGH